MKHEFTRTATLSIGVENQFRNNVVPGVIIHVPHTECDKNAGAPLLRRFRAASPRKEPLTYRDVAIVFTHGEYDPV